MKNLFDQTDCDKMIRRVIKIEQNQKKHFGNLSVQGMLYHCNSVFQAILAGGPTKRPGLKQILFRIIVLNVMQKMPRGKHSSARLFSKDENISFEVEKSRLIHLIQQFHDTKKELIKGQHPVFGTLSPRQWGRFAWIHLDHHLRQFGV